MTYRPSSPVTVERETLVARFFTVTLAPATAAPCGSVSWPDRSTALTCARAGPAMVTASSRRHTIRVRTSPLCIILFSPRKLDWKIKSGNSSARSTPAQKRLESPQQQQADAIPLPTTPGLIRLAACTPLSSPFQLDSVFDRRMRTPWPGELWGGGNVGAVFKRP